MTRLIGVFAAAAAVVLMSGTASPQQPSLGDTFDMIGRGLERVQGELQPKCPPHADVLKIALSNYNEGPVQGGGAMGRDGLPYFFELLLSTTGSWTIIRTGADGQTCAMASGTGWEVTGEPPVPGDPA